jgi:CRISPR/Cas system-associated endoribonuclease Cas2
MPFQYSVFLCDLTSAERFRLLAALADIVDSSVDCVATVELGDPKDQSAFTFVGPRPDIRPSRSTVL